MQIKAKEFCQNVTDKNGPVLGKKPDPNMRIKVEAEKLSLHHMQIKLANQGSNPGKNGNTTSIYITNTKPPTPF